MAHPCNPVMTRLQILEDDENELESSKDGILQLAGWERTCNTPGAYWVWTKTFPEYYGFMMAPTNMAIQMELAWQSLQPENFPEEEDA